MLDRPAIEYIATLGRSQAKFETLFVENGKPGGVRYVALPTGEVREIEPPPVPVAPEFLDLSDFATWCLGVDVSASVFVTEDRAALVERATSAILATLPLARTDQWRKAIALDVRQRVSEFRRMLRRELWCRGTQPLYAQLATTSWQSTTDADAREEKLEKAYGRKVAHRLRAESPLPDAVTLDISPFVPRGLHGVVIQIEASLEVQPGDEAIELWVSPDESSRARRAAVGRAAEIISGELDKGSGDIEHAIAVYQASHDWMKSADTE